MGKDVWDEWAEAIIDELLRRGLLELRSPSSRLGVEGRLAATLSRGLRTGAAVAEAMLNDRGVAELSGEDSEIAGLVARHEPANLTARDESPPASSARTATSLGTTEGTPTEHDTVLGTERRRVARSAAKAKGLRTLEALLSLPPLCELGRQRGGRPGEAAQRCQQQLALLADAWPDLRSTPWMDTWREVVEAPSPDLLVKRLGVAFDSVEPPERALFRVAFGPHPVGADRGPREDQDDEESEDEATRDRTTAPPELPPPPARRVVHPRFGVGVVCSERDDGRDRKLEVTFGDERRTVLASSVTDAHKGMVPSGARVVKSTE